MLLVLTIVNVSYMIISIKSNLKHQEKLEKHASINVWKRKQERGNYNLPKQIHKIDASKDKDIKEEARERNYNLGETSEKDGYHRVERFVLPTMWLLFLPMRPKYALFLRP